MGLRNGISRLIHHPSMQRLAPEWAKECYRRVRNRVQRSFYDPRRFWTRFGKSYMNVFPPTGERSEKLITDTLNRIGARSVADIGCGYGRYLRALRERMPLERLVGIDISPTMIEKAREFLAPCEGIELHVSPATSLPLPEDCVDAVLTYSLMIHLSEEDVDRFLNEAKRVGRAWGLFLESSANPDKPHLNPFYYHAHDYEAAFTRHGITLQEKIPINEKMREYLYVVRLRG